MRGNSAWVSVTEVMQQGSVSVLKDQFENLSQNGKLELYLSRLEKLSGIKNRSFHVEDITREELNIDSVVDIFNKVNSGGTHLSKGDLALAKICAQWPEARLEMNNRLNKWKNAGYEFTLDWLLRCINTLVTGEALFLYLDKVSIGEFQLGLEKAEKRIDYTLNILSSRLGLDHDRVLGARYSIPLIIKYLDQFDGRLDDHLHRGKLLYWYVNVLMWGRYSTGQLESVLNRDLEAIEQSNGGLDQLISLLRSNRGNLEVSSSDFDGWSKGARFYPLLYMMTRTNHALDFLSGVELNEHLLGRNTSLEVHHIFPKSKLYEYGYEKPQVNAIANFTFLTKESNLAISNKDPLDYLMEVQKNHPGTLETHWIPTDPELWKIENYLSFLTARKDLLAKSTNDFMDKLFSGISEENQTPITDTQGIPISIGGIENEDEEKILFNVNDWVTSQGLKGGEILYDLTDEHSGDTIAIIDLCWPDGLQEGLSEPIALMLNEHSSVREKVIDKGIKVFTADTIFKEYIENNIISIESIVV